MATPAHNNMTTAEIAEATGQSMTAVQRHARRGCPCRRSGPHKRLSFNLEDYEAWRAEHGFTGRRGRPAEAPSPELSAAQLRKENALAERYELQAASLRGRTIATADHIAVVTLLTERTVQRLRRLPADVASRLAGLEGGEIQAALEVEVCRACADLSDPCLYTDDGA